MRVSGRNSSPGVSVVLGWGSRGGSVGAACWSCIALYFEGGVVVRAGQVEALHLEPGRRGPAAAAAAGGFSTPRVRKRICICVVIWIWEGLPDNEGGKGACTGEMNGEM